MNIDPPNGDEHTAHTTTLTLHSLDSVDDNSTGIAKVVSRGRVVKGRQIDLDPTHSDGSTALSHDHISTHCVNGSDGNHGASVLRHVVCELPPYEEAAAPNFHWGEIDGETFSHSIECCYAEVVHWKRNLFKIPSGKAGKAFVRELSRLFRAFGDCSALDCVALKAAMVLPALLLQRPHVKSKAKDHSTHLERRLKLWEKGDINSLVIEARTIQRQWEK